VDTIVRQGMDESRASLGYLLHECPPPSPTGIGLSGHSIIDSRHFAFANEPRR
jgi:hypothetical protein